MQVFFENAAGREPRISCVLLNWFGRGSFHTLRCFNDQTVSEVLPEIRTSG